MCRGFETLDSRRVLASITGVVFDDLDDSGTQDAGEVGLDDRLVYIDIDSKLGFSRGDLFQRTSGGQFAFNDLEPGSYQVKMYDGTSFQQTNVPSNTSGHVVVLDSPESTEDLVFAVALGRTDNLAPVPQPFESTISANSGILVIPPGVLQGTVDGNQDNFVAIQVDASSSVLEIETNGSFSFTPAQDFVGTVAASFYVHDGWTASETQTVTITVTPEPEIQFASNGPIAEDAGAGESIGELTLADIIGTYTIFVDDNRFQLQGNTIILAPNVNLNFEAEPELLINVRAVNDNDVNDIIARQIVVPVGNVDEPPTDLQAPGSAVLAEDASGIDIGVVTVIDEDVGQVNQVSVSDPRFAVQDGQLKLLPTASLDFEEESEFSIVLSVGQLTHQVDITVTDVNEPPEINSIDGSVRELTYGAVVGSVDYGDPDSNDTHSFSVSDGRFEVVDGILKLNDASFVSHADEPTVTMTVTVTDSGTPEASASQEVTISVNSIPSPWQNPLDSNDVDDDGDVEPVDALIVLNALNSGGPRALNTPYNGADFIDVNGDGLLTPLDALIIINQLNSKTVSGEGAPPSTQPEGEMLAGDETPAEEASDLTDDSVAPVEIQSPSSQPQPLFAALDIDDAMDDKEDWTTPDLGEFFV